MRRLYVLIAMMLFLAGVACGNGGDANNAGTNNGSNNGNNGSNNGNNGSNNDNNASNNDNNASNNGEQLEPPFFSNFAYYEKDFGCLGSCREGVLVGLVADGKVDNFQGNESEVSQEIVDQFRDTYLTDAVLRQMREGWDCQTTDNGDAGMPDAGAPDGGMPDGGMSDGGMPDGGIPDGGMYDGGTDEVEWWFEARIVGEDESAIYPQKITRCVDTNDAEVMDIISALDQIAADHL